MKPGRDPFLEDEPESTEWRITGNVAIGSWLVVREELSKLLSGSRFLEQREV